MKRPTTATAQIEWERQRKAAAAEHRQQIDNSTARAEITRLIEQDVPVERILVGDQLRQPQSQPLGGRLVPETVAAVSELIRRYDCEQHSCGTVLETRNHAALIRLKRAVYPSERTESP
jgi:hypothetical protein